MNAVETDHVRLPGLAGKVAVVTGAGSGIGEASARRLAKEGTHVVLVDIDGDSVQKVAKSLGDDHLAVAADVANEADVEDYMETAATRFGRIDLYHLNAGIVGTFAPFPEISLADFDSVININLRGVFLGLRAAFRCYARDSGPGAIVVTASIASSRGAADLIPYHASKHGVVGLARCAAVYGGPRGIRVNAVAPGIVLTRLMEAAVVPGGAIDAEERARNSALRRAGSPAEIAALVAWLLSDDSSFVTGEIVSIDGGAATLNPARPSR